MTHLTLALRRAEYWRNRLTHASKDLFPKFSDSQRKRWVEAKLYIGNTLPKVKIGVYYEEYREKKVQARLDV